MNYHNNILYVVQGDDCYLYITILQPNGEVYTMQSGDTLKMTIKSAIDAEDSVEIVSNTNLLTFSTSDTKDIPLGHNVYDVKLIQSATSKTFTIIPVSTLICKPSVGGV